MGKMIERGKTMTELMTEQTGGRVTATELTGAERDEAWARFKARSSGFAEYEKAAQGRVIPVFRLTPR